MSEAILIKNTRPVDDVVTRNSSNLITSGAVHNFVGKKTITKDIVLLANNWKYKDGQYVYRYEDNDIDENVNGLVSLQNNLDDRQKTLLKLINLEIKTQFYDGMEFVVENIQPTIDIPLQLVIF